MPNRYDSVDFMKWDKESKTEKVVCTVSLVDKKLIYVGKDAQSVKDAVEDSDYLKEFGDIGPYTLLSQLAFAFTGSYFYATEVTEASL